MDVRDLSPEVMKRARECETPEDMLRLAEEEGVTLTDDELQAVAGGLECSWFCLSVTACPQDID